MVTSKEFCDWFIIFNDDKLAIEFYANKSEFFIKFNSLNSECAPLRVTKKNINNLIKWCDSPNKLEIKDYKFGPNALFTKGELSIEGTKEDLIDLKNWILKTI